jgi:parallel beta-helix repeat protein
VRTPVESSARSGSGRVSARFDRVTNTIFVTGGERVTLPELVEFAGPDALRELRPGEWLMGADIVVERGATLQIASPEVRWLKLASSGPRFASIKALGGNVDVTASCITSWDPAAGRADTELSDGRGYLLARDGAMMNIDQAELRFLGFSAVESYGLSWRTSGTTGKLTNSVVSHNQFGLYSHSVDRLAVQNNEIHNNVLYGVDPHTVSQNLSIEGNVVHDNGKHGIILAENCTNSVIRNNIVYRNKHHGIVLYLHSNNNVIEGNEAFENASQGININESSDNILRSNKVYDNGESGMAITQTSHNNLVENNQSRSNGQDGLRVVSESTQTTLRGNILGENKRYGVYVATDGTVEINNNVVFSNRVGILLKDAIATPSSDNQVFANEGRDIVNDD